MSSINDFLLFSADSDILLDAEEEILHSSESDICDKRNGSSRNDDYDYDYD